MYTRDSSRHESGERSPEKSLGRGIEIQNALQAIALANGLRRGPSLWSYDGQAKIAFLPLPPHAAYRRNALQAMYQKIELEIEKLNQQVAEQAESRSGARRLMTHPGVGPVTALATDVYFHALRVSRSDMNHSLEIPGLPGPCHL